jgi:hypothetical protein
MEQVNFDIGEEFQNYVLAKEEILYHGVIITAQLCETKDLAEPLMRWTAPSCGWSSLPYFTLRMLARALELCKGDRHDPSNPFQWDSVQLNSPGNPIYDPSIPHVPLIHTSGAVASGVITFFDDGRVYAVDKLLTHDALRRMCSLLQYYSIKMPLENEECQAYEQMLGVVVVYTQIRIYHGNFSVNPNGIAYG